MSERDEVTVMYHGSAIVTFVTIDGTQLMRLEDANEGQRTICWYFATEVGFDVVPLVATGEYEEVFQKAMGGWHVQIEELPIAKAGNA